MSRILISLLFAAGVVFSQERLTWHLPVDAGGRDNVSKLRLTPIGRFGEERKPRKTVAAHLHTGVDIRRPSDGYIDEKVFPACKGVVISVRDDGPYSQIIIEHRMTESSVWTVYEHIGGIACKVDDSVSPERAIARFYSRAELDKYGWQFDHLHFEVMKAKPMETVPTRQLPQRRYATYGLTCYTFEELLERYYNPIEFLKEVLKK
jgi:hypothetical protein